MKRYVRYRPTLEEGDDDAKSGAWGVLEGGVVYDLVSSPFEAEVRSGASTPLQTVRLLAPCEPSKVIAVGRNFRSHLQGRETPLEPGLFAKLPSSIIGPGDPIVLPPDADDVHFEGELVVVIGKRARRVSVDRASDHVFGVTAGNDVSARGWQKNDLQWLRAKGSDSFGPLGPTIATDANYNDLLIETRLNGELVQSERSRDFIFPVSEIVSYASRYFTLLPGDVIFTGTPGSTSALSRGDRVEVKIQAVGTLENHVVSSADARAVDSGRA